MPAAAASQALCMHVYLPAPLRRGRNVVCMMMNKKISRLTTHDAAPCLIYIVSIHRLVNLMRRYAFCTHNIVALVSD